MALASTEVLSLIPQPLSVETYDGEWALPSKLKLSIAEEFPTAIDSLALLLNTNSHFGLQELNTGAVADVTIQVSSELGEEAYRLEVGQSGIRIEAASDAGVFYALQTVRQLLPTSVYSAGASGAGANRTGADSSASSSAAVVLPLTLPFVRIEDAPRFNWRGMHLDVSRHFMPVQFVKKYIDVLALHKFNRFHWHLTDDQGWRVEIKQYPKLTAIGSKRAQTVVGHALLKPKEEKTYDGTPHGGFYTQEQIREVVAFATARHIEVVPEIEFPGHAQAAIAAYPSLGNSGKQLKVKEEWGISKNTIKPSEETLQFYRNVLREVMDLFPSRYIHIGGDEASKEQWKNSSFAQQRIKNLGLNDEKELQSWLIQQMDDFLNANHRTLIGWDEIMQGGLSRPSSNSRATVMAWRGLARGEDAARAGHDVIMAPTSHTYFDYYQADKANEPLAIGGYTSLEKVYSFEPLPHSLPAEFQAHILGGQGQLWTEFIKTAEHLEYMAFPRAVALSEVLWSPINKRDFDDFQQRLPKHLERLHALKVNYRPPGDDQLSTMNAIKNFFLNRLVSLYHWYTDL